MQGFPHSINRTQLEISYYRGSGAGGQKRNKTSSGCMIKHIPTGHITRCDEFREQSKNRERAFNKLAEILVPIMKKEVQRERYSAGTERIRTYNEKQDLVSDVRVEETISYKEAMEGKIGKIIEAVVLSQKE